MVYILKNTDKLSADIIENCLPLLSVQRRSKLNAYGSVLDRVNGCAVYILLRYALIKGYGYTNAPVFIFGEHGKPLLSDRKDLYFNMSHCRNAVCCIMSDKNTAVDITDIRTVRSGIIRRVCSMNEQELITGSADPQRMFLRLWTRKECLSKLSGMGMSQGFRSLTDELPEASGLHTTDFGDHILTYYSEKEEKINILSDPQRLISFLKENADPE